MRILLVEDDGGLQAPHSQNFYAGPVIPLSVSGDGIEGLFFHQGYPLDLAPIDLGLPGFLPGLDLNQRIA